MIGKVRQTGKKLRRSADYLVQSPGLPALQSSFGKVELLKDKSDLLT